MKAFPDKVHLSMKDFPLPMHDWARSAAIAGRCVVRQNPAAFWDYFDWAYENQQSMGVDNFSAKLQAFAAEKGLDATQVGPLSRPEVDGGGGEQIHRRRSRPGHRRHSDTLHQWPKDREGGIPWQNMEALINLELAHTAKAAEAADKVLRSHHPEAGGNDETGVLVGRETGQPISFGRIASGRLHPFAADINPKISLRSSLFSVARRK